MVKVRSSSGGFVNVEIKGVAEAMRYIRRKGKDLEGASDTGVFQAANFVQQEVQESIIGKRAEPKSVDTGRFANSINVDKIKKSIYKVFTKVPYAEALEHGTTRIKGRHHFENTRERTRHKVRRIIEIAIKKI